jgi:hypothetical protein
VKRLPVAWPNLEKYLIATDIDFFDWAETKQRRASANTNHFFDRADWKGSQIFVVEDRSLTSQSGV